MSRDPQLPPRTIVDAVEALRSGATTSVDLVRTAIEASESNNARLAALVELYRESALEAAIEADRVLDRAGRAAPILTGIPLGIKDIITTREGPTTAESDASGATSLAGDATAVRRLRSAGGIIMGKTATMEFAFGMPDEPRGRVLARNPWNVEKWAGGSSSGSASGIQAGMFLGALGTDTAGSIRLPAAFCGISGLKPTFGRVPTSGCLPLAYSLDHIGPMARSAADCALLLRTLAGPDGHDPQGTDQPVEDYLAGLSGDLTGIRVGVIEAGAANDAEPQHAVAFRESLRQFQSLGARLVDVQLPSFVEASTATMTTLIAEAAAEHAEGLTSQYLAYGRSLRSRLLTSAFLSATDYIQAQRVRRVAQLQLARVYDDVDLIVLPTSIFAAFDCAQLSARDEVDLKSSTGIPTAYWNAVGNPVLSIPIGFARNGLPLGLQIAGRPFDERLVLRAGDAFQRITRWHLETPTSLPTGSVPEPADPGPRGHAGEHPRSADMSPPTDRGSTASTVVRGLLAMADLTPPELEFANAVARFGQTREDVRSVRVLGSASATVPATRFSAVP
ncbi:amidase [Jatrophihabitans cynanchi]|uniref:Amidase n=1 Tax=Jatrophihabitans cynanchi TaxID=2944128 RepID=A0ABY7K108_9ACTN|nr:amidase [Jatrophihabitans sp. SB3-54]WAX58354.1 amidase [Jatrophihabitans sp. SB3-54]